MTRRKYKVLLFDAANTLIYKPDLWLRIGAVLKNYGIEVDELELRKKHKLLSEIIHFPDRTSADFYRTFNYEYLLSLGVAADDKMLDELFVACTYLPWRAFEDTKYLTAINTKKAILSNFNSQLADHIYEIFDQDLFDTIIGSEKAGISKPDIAFYKHALDILNVKPEEVFYVGDSLKLDIVPAQSLGIDSWLIDRDNNYKAFKKRITSFSELEKVINYNE